MELSFVKNQRRWHMYVYLRQPVKADQENEALDVLRSFRFTHQSK